MRMSQLFSATLREAPADADVISHQLLLKAGFIRQLGAGIFSYLPLGLRVITRIETIMREEMNSIGGQEVSMPVVHPADLWQRTGRWADVDDELTRFKDRNAHDMVLATTHEEVVANLAAREIHSYRQLPQLIYQIQIKFRDDPRPRAGLIGAREFTMLDSYSLDRNQAGLELQYQAHYDAYLRIFARCRLPVKVVGSDTGIMGGTAAHEYMYLTPIGEDTLFFCNSCDYAANRQVAVFKKAKPEFEDLLPIEKVATPGTSSIVDLAAFLEVHESRIAKAVFLMAELMDGRGPQLIFAVLRGDTNLNENKLINALAVHQKGQVKTLRPALNNEIKASGACPGYASPIGIDRDRVWVVVDDLILSSANLVAGANEEGFHLLHTNFGRDYDGDIIADIALAEDGVVCMHCGGELKASRGVEVANIFKLGTRYTDAMGARYKDENGEFCSMIMGSYGIGIGRLLACVAEEHHDKHGLIWPKSITPYPVHLVLLGSKDPSVEVAANNLYHALIEAGVEPLYDDRNESPGVKFNDADLIGIPLRVTVSERALQSGGYEFKRRHESERWIVPINEAINVIYEELA